MIITTAEYRALFGNKNPSEVSNEDVIKAREEKRQLDAGRISSIFRTWKEPGIIYDECGNASVGIIERTGFEGEGY